MINRFFYVYVCFSLKTSHTTYRTDFKHFTFTLLPFQEFYSMI